LGKFLSARSRTTVYLVHRLGDGNEQVVVWDTTDIRVGRRRSMDLVIPDAEVSREHAIFEKNGERLSVKDLGTGIGTFVNGERITKAELKIGDIVKIGNLELRVGRTDKQLRPANNIRFASDLKSGMIATPAQVEGGRTMLAFDIDDDLAFSKPTQAVPETSQRRAVSLDGSLQDAEDDDPLGLSIDADMLLGKSENSAVRNLDVEFDETPPGDAIPGGGLPPITVAPRIPPYGRGDTATPPPPPTPAVSAVGTPTAASLSDARTRRTLALEIDGPENEVERFLAVIDGKAISVGSIQLRVKKLDFD
jgi:pSer/pThr/pTyr-binding forkhead associated (FHA) protein